VTGLFQTLPLASCSGSTLSCKNKCNEALGYGICTNGNCVCNQGRTGQDCSQAGTPLTVMHTNQSRSLQIWNNALVWFYKTSFIQFSNIIPQSSQQYYYFDTAPTDHFHGAQILISYNTANYLSVAKCEFFVAYGNFGNNYTNLPNWMAVTDGGNWGGVTANTNVFYLGSSIFQVNYTSMVGSWAAAFTNATSELPAGRYYLTVNSYYQTQYNVTITLYSAPQGSGAMIKPSFAIIFFLLLAFLFNSQTV